jgi:hypothetical protein
MRVVIAVDDERGNVVLTDAGAPNMVPAQAQTDQPGIFNGVFYWATGRAPVLPGYPGEPASDFSFAGRGESRFGIFEFAANSAGKFAAPSRTDDAADGDPEMHRTDTIDYEIIMSGEIDVEFPGGVTTTLRQGDAIVMGGSAHAWKNRRDEPCRIATIMIGASRGSA